MLNIESINKIQVSPFCYPRGDRFSIKNGLLLTFPTDISPEELEDVYCDYCPLNQYRVDTIGTEEGYDRRKLIRCAGQLLKERILGPIHISQNLDSATLAGLFEFEDATPCGVYHKSLQKLLRTSKVGLPKSCVRLGEI